MKIFFITTAIDYPNSLPHVGTAFEKIGADVMARYKRLCGYETCFLMGNDEHAVNVEKKALSLGLDTQEYCNQMAEKFKAVWKQLNVSYDRFIQTSEPVHMKASQEMFLRAQKNGDIYKGKYKGWYCNSCESYVKEKDLVDGKCPVHNMPPAAIEEENYFFALSKYRDKILKFIEENPSFVEPEIRRNEVLNILREGLEDLSISRSNFKWGIPVPGDDSGHAIYVWFDALINYITGAGFADDAEKFSRLWPADVHVIGKDITRFHCIIWPAMLMSAGVALPKKVFGHGFVYNKGAKMSKTLGTVVDPAGVAEKYGADALRFFLVRENPFGQDGEFSIEKLESRFNSDLANDLGNLLHRTLTMTEKYQQGRIARPADMAPDAELQVKLDAAVKAYEPLMDAFEFRDALAKIWELISYLNTYIEKSAPWTLAKEKKFDRIAKVMYNVCESLRIISIMISPVVPASAEKIYAQLGLDAVKPMKEASIKDAHLWGVIPDGLEVKKGAPVFQRIV